jgi:hypothetical protein
MDPNSFHLKPASSHPKLDSFQLKPAACHPKHDSSHVKPDFFFAELALHPKPDFILILHNHLY